MRLIIPMIVLLYLAMSCGKPQSSYSCADDEAAIRTEQGKIICWHLSKCPHGFGLSFEHKPGYIHSSESIKVQCVACKSGRTYSDRHDFSQCKDCTQCKDNEIFTGICKQSKDEIHCTGQCKEGFYMSNSTASCVPCSQCCIDSGCANSCRPEMTSKNCTKPSNGTEIPGSKISVEDMDRPIKVHKVKDRTKDVVKIVVPVVCFAVVLSMSIIAVIVYREKICERIGNLVASAVNSTGNNSDSTIEPRSLQGNVYRQQLHSPLSSPPPLSPQPEQHSQSDTLAPGQSSISDSTEQLVTDSGLPGRIPGQQACSPQRVLTDSGQPAYNTVQTHRQINPQNVDNAEENFDKLLVSISPRVSMDWKPLGGLLGVEPHELSNIDDENRRTKDKAYQMLTRWRQKKGRGATPQVLLAALREMELNSLGDIVQEFIVTGQYTISNSG